MLVKRIESRLQSGYGIWDGHELCPIDCVTVQRGHFFQFARAVVYSDFVFLDISLL